MFTFTNASSSGSHSHDTPSVGGFVMLMPLIIAEHLRTQNIGDREREIERVQEIARVHLFLTHPDEEMGRVCDIVVWLVAHLLFREGKIIS